MRASRRVRVKIVTRATVTHVHTHDILHIYARVMHAHLAAAAAAAAASAHNVDAPKGKYCSTLISAPGNALLCLPRVRNANGTLGYYVSVRALSGD